MSRWEGKSMACLAWMFNLPHVLGVVFKGWELLSETYPGPSWLVYPWWLYAICWLTSRTWLSCPKKPCCSLPLWQLWVAVIPQMIASSIMKMKPIHRSPLTYLAVQWHSTLLILDFPSCSLSLRDVPCCSEKHFLA